MNIFQAIVLGLVQGLAEFLPISSSGHLILSRALLGISDATAASGGYMMFDILLHAGTLAAVVVVFWKDWMGILRNPFRSKTLLLLFIASLPALFIAVLLNDILESFFTGWFLGFSFLLTAVFMYLAQTVSQRGGRHTQRAEEPGYKHAVSMGCMQAVALLPGVSRSGSALLGGLASGLSRQAAAKFAFMMSAPAILGSLLIEGRSALKEGLFDQLEIMPTAIGMVVAAVSGYLAIRFMLRLISKISLKWFALYVAVVGIIVIVLQLTMPGFLPPLAFPKNDLAQQAALAVSFL